MKLISWNINGFLARIQNGFWDLIDDYQPDIICLQETKGDESQIPIGMDLITRGYEIYWNGGETRRNGVAILALNNQFSEVNFNSKVFDGRVVAIENEDIFIVNVYSPLSGAKLENLEERIEWEDFFREEMQKLKKIKPVVICGDLNVAHRSYESGAKTKIRKTPGFSDEEWAKFQELLDLGFLDPVENFGLEIQSQDFEMYSHSHSWRLDYTLIDTRLVDYMQGTFIIPKRYGSDHYPVGLEILL